MCIRDSSLDLCGRQDPSSQLPVPVPVLQAIGWVLLQAWIPELPNPIWHIVEPSRGRFASAVTRIPKRNVKVPDWPRAHFSPTILVEESAENVTVDLLCPFDKPLRVNK